MTYVLAEQRDRDVVAALISRTVDVRTIVGSRRSVWKSPPLIKDVS